MQETHSQVDESFSASIDPQAAQHWSRIASASSAAPWLHDEVALRLQDRIELVQLPPIQAWANWQYPFGRVALHDALQARWPQAQAYAPGHTANATSKTIAARADFSTENVENTLKTSSSRARQWLEKLLPASAASKHQTTASPALLPLAPPPLGVELIVANMLLHSSANPGQLLRTWHASLATGGLLFFTCLGPESLQPLQQIYKRLGWPVPMQRFVDMHDWGDALVNTGFATPVMEMERLDLSYSSPQALLAELRELGRNLHPKRFASLRGRQWYAQLLAEIESLRSTDGRIHMPVEIIYAHAFKPAPRTADSGETLIQLDQLRRNLPQSKK